MYSLRMLALGAVAAVAAGCGFQPVYGPQGSGAPGNELAAVRVALIDSRLGQLVREALLDGLDSRNREGIPRRYELGVQVAESRRDIAVERDIITTRTNLTLTARYTLAEIGTGEEVFSGRARTINAYDVSTAPFAELTSADDTRRTASRELAETILIQLAVYFSGAAARDGATGRSGQ